MSHVATQLDEDALTYYKERAKELRHKYLVPSDCCVLSFCDKRDTPFRITTDQTKKANGDANTE